MLHLFVFFFPGRARIRGLYDEYISVRYCDVDYNNSLLLTINNSLLVDPVPVWDVPGLLDDDNMCVQSPPLSSPVLYCFFASLNKLDCNHIVALIALLSSGASSAQPLTKYRRSWYTNNSSLLTVKEEANTGIDDNGRGCEGAAGGANGGGGNKEQPVDGQAGMNYKIQQRVVF